MSADEFQVFVLHRLEALEKQLEIERKTDSGLLHMVDTKLARLDEQVRQVSDSNIQLSLLIKEQQQMLFEHKVLLQDYNYKFNLISITKKRLWTLLVILITGILSTLSGYLVHFADPGFPSDEIDLITSTNEE